MMLREEEKVMHVCIIDLILPHQSIYSSYVSETTPRTTTFIYSASDKAFTPVPQ